MRSLLRFLVPVLFLFSYFPDSAFSADQPEPVVLNARTKKPINYTIDLSSVTLTLVQSQIPALDWAKITTGKPTTIGGYGITDFNSLGDARWPQLGGSYANPSWITSIPFSKLTATPTSIGGYGIVLPAADIPALDWSKITTGKPTSIGGYGIVLPAADIPALDAAKITTGVFDNARIPPDNGRQVYNARAFGAIGDGTAHPLSDTFASLAAAQVIYPQATDLANETDTAAILAALSTAMSVSGELFLPAGTYLIDNTRSAIAGPALYVNQGAVTISGAGSGTILKAKDGSNISAVISVGGIPNTADRSAIFNLAIDGNKAGGVNANGIEIINSDHSTIQNVSIRDTGQLGVSIGAARYSQVFNVSVENSGNTGIAMLYGDSRGTVIRDCRVFNPFVNGFQVGGTDVLVDGCYATGAHDAAAGLYVFSGSRRIRIQNSTFIRNGAAGIDVGAGVRGSTSSGPDQSEAIIVTGNNCSYNFGIGIATASNGTIVTNNQAVGNGGGGGRQLLSYAVSTGGVGYEVDDILTLSGGTISPFSANLVSTISASVKVASVNGSGAITAFNITPVSTGRYATIPTNPVTLTGGHGTSGTLNVTGWSTPVLNLQALGSIAAGGSSYAVGDVLTFSGGTGPRPAKVTITSVSSGAVTGIAILDPGSYTAQPSSPIATTSYREASSNGAAGTGATINASSWAVLYSSVLYKSGFFSNASNCVIASNLASNTAEVSAQEYGLYLPTTGVQPSDCQITNNNFSGNATNGANVPFSRTHTVAGNSGLTLSFSLADASVSIPAGTRLVTTTVPFSGSHTITLPAASSLPANTTLLFIDQVGALSAANPALFRALPSTDTLNGATSATSVTVGEPYCIRAFISDGVSAWVVNGADPRFPASVTGLRKGAGIGSLDTAAVAGVDYLLPPQVQTQAADASFVITNGKTVVILTADFTATHTITLPAASSLSAGSVLRFIDQVGGLSLTSFANFRAAPSTDTLNGATSGTSFSVKTAFAVREFVTNGVNAWTSDSDGFQ